MYRTRARRRARAEQCALRPAQHFETLQIEQIQIRREQRHRNRRLVEIHADRFFHAGLIAHDLAGADAANRDLALARPEIGDGQAGEVAGQLDDAAAPELRICSSLAAATENGTSCSAVSRFCAVTMIRSSGSSAA